jgi:hypothetical protein
LSAEPLVTLGRRPLLRAAPNDRYFDYCLQPYEPRRAAEGKLRSENLFWQSFDLAGGPPALELAVLAIQRAAGRDMTVFGVKHAAGRLWWELYFYEADKGAGAVRAAGVAEAAAPWFVFAPSPRESIPYFMFSFDIDAETPARGRVDALNYYLPYHEVQGGRSYKQTAGGLELENIYRFYHPKREVNAMLHDIKASAFIDYATVPLSRVLLPELFACNRICVAKKRHADAVYYSGVDVDQLRFFLRRFDYPAAIVDFVDRHRAELEHLRFDVGVDVALDAEGRLTSTKSSYYGTL